MWAGCEPAVWQLADGHSRGLRAASMFPMGTALPNERYLACTQQSSNQAAGPLPPPPAATATELTGDSLPVPMIMDFQIIRAEVMIMPAGKTGQL